MVELLLAVALMSLVTAVAIPNLREFNRGQEIDGARSQVINALKNAQSSAVSHIQCPSGVISTNWNVTLNASNYSINCLVVLTGQQVYTSPYASTPTSSTTFQMTNSSCSGALVITFTNQLVSYTCAGAAGTLPLTITIRNTAGTTTRQIILEQGGIIRGV